MIAGAAVRQQNMRDERSFEVAHLGYKADEASNTRAQPARPHGRRRLGDLEREGHELVAGCQRRVEVLDEPVEARIKILAAAMHSGCPDGQRSTER